MLLINGVQKQNNKESCQPILRSFSREYSSSSSTAALFILDVW